MVITWLQNSTQKHHRLIFGFLLVVVGVSFVFYTGGTGNNPQLGGRSAEYLGVDLSSPRAIQRFEDPLRLTAMPEDNEVRLRRICLGIAQKHLADQLGVPVPGEAEVQAWVREAFKSISPQGLTTQAWEAYVTELQARFDCGRDEALARFETCVEDILRWQATARLLAGPGHASPAQVRALLTSVDTRWTTRAATLPLATFRPAFADDLAKAKAHFAANIEAHRIPGSVVARAVTFPSPPPARRTVTEDEILTHAYNFAGELGIPAGKVSEEALRRKEEITARILARSAIEEEAARLSDGLLEAFPSVDDRPADAALEAWLRERKASAGAPVTLVDGAAAEVPGVPAPAVTAASRLAEGSAWHTEFYVGAKGPVMLLVDRRTPSRLPAFEEAKEKALADWRESERGRLFILRSKELADAVRKAMAGGETFPAAASRLGLSVAPETVTFAANDIPEALRGPGVPAETALAEAGEGKSTDAIRVRGGDFVILHALRREIPAIDAKDPRLEPILRGMAADFAETTLEGARALDPSTGRLTRSGTGLLDELTTAPGAANTAER